jgi:hypothetical protein
MIERNVELARLEWEFRYRSRSSSEDEVGESVAELIRQTQDKIDQAFTKGVKYPAKLRTHGS